MSSLEALKSIYKPYRYTINNNATIIESTTGKFVIKKQNKDLFELFNYLKSRGFNEYPSLLRSYDNNENVFEFIEDASYIKEQKLMDLSDTLASLHNKTVYFKNTSIDNYKEIKENIENNIKYLDNYYKTIFLKFLKNEYNSPSQYLYLRNYYKIKDALLFCQNELDDYYDMVKDNNKERVAVVHNNLSMNHFILNNDRKALISWDNYKIDTPVLDFVHLYNKEFNNYEFTEFLKKYLNNFELLDSEKKLLFILISLPIYNELTFIEKKDIIIVKELYNYIFTTEKLIKPYYEKE